MKKHLLVLIAVLLIAGAWAAWALWPRTVAVLTPGTVQKDSLLRGEAVFWPEQQAYFRIRQGRWEKSTNIFDSPFIPVATEEAGQKLYTHFNITASEVNPPPPLPSPDKNKDPLKQNPAAPKETAPKPSEPKTSVSKGDKQVVVSEDEALKKAEEAAKKKAEEKKKDKEGAKKKSANRANAADEYWSKVKLVGGRYKGSKEEAVELFKNAPLQYPNLKANQYIFSAVEAVKE